MERKKWLETFIRLADTNRPAIEYRKRLGVAHATMPITIKRLPAFRRELEEILKAEEEVKLKSELAEKKAKEAKEKKHAIAQRKLRTATRESQLKDVVQKPKKSKSTTTRSNRKTLGTREDNPEE